MADGFIHTVWKAGEWQNEIEGGDHIPGSFSTKEEALEAGRSRALADETEHVIHNQDGTISERNSYGNDPAHRPGQAGRALVFREGGLALVRPG